MAEQEEKTQRGMVVVAHADDAEWGCSGTVAKLCAEGWEMVYVLCTISHSRQALPIERWLLEQITKLPRVNPPDPPLQRGELKVPLS